jgi:hypothetical protein
MLREERTDWNLVYGALADDRRRELLRYLAHATERRTITDVVEHLYDGDEPTEDERARFVANLYHVHLPKLADADLVEWDQNRETVALASLTYQLPVGTISPETMVNHETVAEQASD